MPVYFKSEAIQNFYDTNEYLLQFRALDANKAAALDARIAQLELAILPEVNNNGKSTYDFPFDEQGLKREFLDEVLAILMSNGYAAHASKDGNNVTDTEKVAYAIPNADNFDLLSWEEKKKLVIEQAHGSGHTVYGASILDQYAKLIDDVIAESKKLAMDPIDPGTTTEVDTLGIVAIPPFTFNGIVYDRIGIDNNGRRVYVPTSATLSSVAKSTVYNQGDVPVDTDFGFTPGGATSAQGLVQGTITTNSTIHGTIQFSLSTSAGYSVATSPDATSATIVYNSTTVAVPIVPLTPPQTINGVVCNFKFNHDVYGLGPHADTNFYLKVDSPGVVGSAATLISPTLAATTNSNRRYLSPMEYLYYWTEAKVDIVRAQLAYRSLVVREIQNDLAQANKALGQLEQQAGGTRALQGDAKNPDATRETLEMDLFEAMHSTSSFQLFDKNGAVTGVSFSAESGGSYTADITDDWHNYSNWATSRANLNTYIDTRSAEAQQAMLDYQQMLNRYNSAYEVMAKLQDKINDLVQTSFRNF